MTAKVAPSPCCHSTATGRSYFLTERDRVAGVGGNERPEWVCGFNRWTQQIGEIVQRVFRSLAFSLGGYLVASLLHLAWLASRWKYTFPWGNTAAIAHLYFHWSPAA